MPDQVRDGLEVWMPGSASDVIQARILRYFPDLVRDLGGDPAVLLGAVGLDPDSCDREGVVTCRQWITVLELAASALKANDFGLQLAERQQGTDMFGPLGRVMRNCRNFGDALHYAATHNAAHSLAARVWMGRTASGRTVFMGHELLAEEPGARLQGRRQAIEHALLSGHLAAGAMTGGRVRVRRVHFRHEAMSPPSVYRRYFQCDVRFVCNEDGVAFAAEDMAQRLLDPDEVPLNELMDAVERHYGARRPPFCAQVRGVVMQLLWTGRCAVDDVADVLKLHPRALHRRLRDERCQFQAIKDDVRRDILLYYLQYTAIPLGRISEKLGFSEQSAMSRFARAQLAASPRQLRRLTMEPRQNGSVCKALPSMPAE